MADSKKQQMAQLQSLVTGVPIYAATTVLQLDGETITGPQLVTTCSALVTAGNATITAKAAYQAALAAEQKLFTANLPLIEKARQGLALAFGNSPTALAGLGISARKKPAPLPPEALVARAAKAKATREARGTKGPKQKAAIVGNVSGVTITPVTTATTPTLPSTAGALTGK